MGEMFLRQGFDIAFPRSLDRNERTVGGMPVAEKKLVFECPIAEIFDAARSVRDLPQFQDVPSRCFDREKLPNGLGRVLRPPGQNNVKPLSVDIGDAPEATEL